MLSTFIFDAGIVIPCPFIDPLKRSPALNLFPEAGVAVILKRTTAPSTAFYSWVSCITTDNVKCTPSTAGAPVSNVI